jgi:hypothetical protein
MEETRNPEGQAPLGVRPRPGLVTFAAIMLFLLAGFQLTYAIIEFAGATWVAFNVAGTMGGPLWLWGIIDLAFAALVFYAGYDLLRGGDYGRIVGLIVASFSAIRWFFYIPAAPWASVVVIAVNILIIYGLAAHSEFFRSAQAT